MRSRSVISLVAYFIKFLFLTNTFVIDNYNLRKTVIDYLIKIVYTAKFRISVISTKKD